MIERGFGRDVNEEEAGTLLSTLLQYQYNKRIIKKVACTFFFIYLAMSDNKIRYSC